MTAGNGTAGRPPVDRPRVSRVPFQRGCAVGATSALAGIVLFACVVQAISVALLDRRLGEEVLTIGTKDGRAPWSDGYASGRGTMRVWATGAVKYGALLPDPDGSVGALEVGAVSSEGATHTVWVHVSPRTELLLGGEPYRSGALPPVLALFGTPEEGGTFVDATFQQRPLTVDFHMTGLQIVADRVDAPLEAQENPFSRPSGR